MFGEMHNPCQFCIIATVIMIVNRKPVLEFSCLSRVKDMPLFSSIHFFDELGRGDPYCIYYILIGKKFTGCKSMLKKQKKIFQSITSTGDSKRAGAVVGIISDVGFYLQLEVCIRTSLIFCYINLNVQI